MQRVNVAFVAVFLMAASTGACRSTSTPAPAAVSADTWAVVNGKAVTSADVDKEFRRSGDGSTTGAEAILTAKLAILDGLILEEILMDRARQQNLQVPDAEVDAALTKAKGGLNDDAFQQQLIQRGLSTADVRDGLRRQLLAEKVMERDVTSKVTVSDQQVTDFFNANRAQFNLPQDAVHLAQIVITPVRDPQLANRTGDDATTPDTATAKVRMLMQRLQEGAPFADLARDFSEDPESAPRGGDLGLVPVATIRQAPAALRDAALQLDPGRARVVSQGGAHTIVFVVKREQAGQRDLSTPGVKEQITQALKGRREQLLRTAYLASARADAQVVNYEARRVVEAQGVIPGTAASTPTPTPTPTTSTPKP
jgi:peptidyl-prolyl cis-trans isomerase SurA